MQNIKQSIQSLRKKLNGVHILNTGNEWIEIMPRNINKAERIKEIMNKEHLTEDEIMVFGDSQNDIEMFKLTSNSYVMENADQEVKQYATYVIGHLNENAVAEIIKKLL